jgi:uncharacterized protein YoxC
VELFKNISTVVGVIISLVTLITLIKTRCLGLLDKRIKDTSKTTDINTRVENIEKKLDQLIEKENTFSESITSAVHQQGEACKQMMANIIETTYFANRESKTLNTIELKRIINTYSIYHELHGNSYITQIYEEMLEWERVD